MAILIRVLALCALVWVDATAKRQQTVVPVPAELVNPSLFPPLAEDNFESLVAHGRALVEYGQALAVYARPACEAASYFVCYDTAESSQESVERWLPRAVEMLQTAIRLQPSDNAARRVLLDTHLAMSNLSAALDLYEHHLVNADRTATLSDGNDAILRAHVLVRVHVLATRNCLWAEVARAHLRISDLLLTTNATIPAMHMAEIPGWPGKMFLRNMRALNHGIEAALAAQLAAFEAKRSTYGKQRKRKPKGARKLKLGYVSSTGFRSSTSSRALVGLFLARSRRHFHVVCYAGEGEDSSSQRALIRDNCDEFVEAAGWNPARLAKKVAHDDIDILVDLLGVASGTALAGLPAFRQASLQINFHGQPFTTGCRCLQCCLPIHCLPMQPHAQVLWVCGRVVRHCATCPVT